MLLIPSTVFRGLIDEREAMLCFVFNLLSLRLSGVMELVEAVAFGRLDERLREHLILRGNGFPGVSRFHFTLKPL